MMDTEFGILIRTLIAVIGLMVLAYIMGDYHSKIKEYFKKQKKKRIRRNTNDGYKSTKTKG